MRFFPLVILAVFLTGCGDPSITSDVSVLGTRNVTLPNGDKIAAEVVVKTADVLRGLMFRESLPAGKGMLFVYENPAAIRVWTYRLNIPIDIVFLDLQHKVLGTSFNTPPCNTRSSECLTYGGLDGTSYMLQVGAGVAQKAGVMTGMTLSF
jgi:uncharacterized protein